MEKGKPIEEWTLKETIDECKRHEETCEGCPFDFSTCPFTKCYAPTDWVFTERPCFTEKEIEAAKTLKCMWPDSYIEFTRDTRGDCRIMVVRDEFPEDLWLGNIALFPSILPGASVMINEVPDE